MDGAQASSGSSAFHTPRELRSALTCGVTGTTHLTLKIGASFGAGGLDAGTGGGSSDAAGSAATPASAGRAREAPTAVPAARRAAARASIPTARRASTARAAAATTRRTAARPSPASPAPPRLNGLAFRVMGRDDEIDNLVQDTFIAALSSLGRLEKPDAFASPESGVDVDCVHLAGAQVCAPIGN